jgi:hypothetical protein
MDDPMPLPHPSPSAASAEPWVADQLARIANERPHLQALIGHLGAGETGFEITPSFLNAYGSAGADDRAVLLRPLFTDERPGGRAVLTAPIARRIVAYLHHLPSRPLLTGHCHREEIPKPLARWFGAQRGRWAELSSPLVAELWAHAVAGVAPVPPNGNAAWPEDAWAALLPLLEARMLSPDVAAQAVERGYTSPFARYYFEAPIDALLVRNMLVLMDAVLKRRQGGREQNSIPLQWSRRFSLSPRSVPETLAMVDVLALVYGRVSSLEEDPLGIGDLFKVPVLGGHRAFWGPVIGALANRTLVGESDLDGTGVFDSSLRFNVARATGLQEGRVARLAAFSPYYRNVDRNRLLATCMPTWSHVSTANARRCAALAARPDAEPPIRLRDLGNIISLRSREGPELVLPPVARYALGQPEPLGPSIATGRSRASRGAPKPQRHAALEALIRELDAAPIRR